MKILNCHINSFGSLCDYSVDFKDGITSITEQNGFGKTTLSAFIKAMFYSMKPARKTDSHLSRERLRYYPWSGGDYGGSLDFKVGDKTYRIIRHFDKYSATQDKFSLVDLDTKTECDDFSENIGNELFGVDVDGFSRSTFSDGQVKIEEMPASVRSKISSNLDIADDFDGYESAQKKLSEALKTLTGREKEIDKTRKNIQSAKAECERLSRNVAGYDALSEKANLYALKNEEIKKEIALLDKKIDAVSSKEASALKLKRYNDLVEKSRQINAEISALLEKFGGVMPQIEDVEALSKLVEQKKNAEILLLSENRRQQNSDYQKLLEIFDNGIPDNDEIKVLSENVRAYYSCLERISALENELESAQTELSRSPVILNGEYTDAQLNSLRLSGAKAQSAPVYSGAKANYTPVFIISAVVLAAGIGVCFLDLVIGVVIAALGVIGIVAGALLSSVKKMLGAGGSNLDTAEAEAVKEFLVSCGFSPDAEINSAIDRVRAAQDIKKKILDFSENLKTESEKSESLKTKIEEHLEKYVEITNSDYASALENLKACVNRYNNEVIPAIEARDNLEKQKARLQKDISELFEKIGVKNDVLDAETAFKSAKEELSQIERLQKEYEENTRLSKEYFKQNKIDEIKPQKEEISLEELRYNKEALEREREKNEQELAALRQNMQMLSNSKAALTEQEEFIDSESEKLLEFQKKAQILEKTLELLLISKNELSKKYAASLNTAFEKYSSIFFGNTEDFSINHQMDLSVVKEGISRDASCFSEGQQAVMDICLRLSLIDTMFEIRRPMLILDDPFSSMDGENLKKATALLKEVSKNTQIIYLTCHESREI